MAGVVADAAAFVVGGASASAFAAMAAVFFRQLGILLWLAFFLQEAAA